MPRRFVVPACGGGWHAAGEEQVGHGVEGAAAPAAARGQGAAHQPAAQRQRAAMPRLLVHARSRIPQQRRQQPPVSTQQNVPSTYALNTGGISSIAAHAASHHQIKRTLASISSQIRKLEI